jgi:DNA-binding CsgD family transcriptional regulator
MASTVREADLRGLLAVLDAGRTDSESEGFPTALLEGLRSLIRCDSVSFMDFDIARQECLYDQTLPDEEATTQTPADDVFWHHYDVDLHSSYPTRTGDERSVITVSDFYSIREAHNTPCTATTRGTSGSNVSFAMPARAARQEQAIAPHEGTGTRLRSPRPAVARAAAAALSELDQQIQHRRHPIPNLTARQWELLRLTARGDTNSEIARTLFISTDTVRKHLENIFARLGVANRMAAVAKAFPAGPR